MGSPLLGYADHESVSVSSFSKCFYPKAGSVSPWSNWALRASLKGPVAKSFRQPWELNQWPADHRHSVQTQLAMHHSFPQNSCVNISHKRKKKYGKASYQFPIVIHGVMARTQGMTQTRSHARFGSHLLSLGQQHTWEWRRNAVTFTKKAVVHLYSLHGQNLTHGGWLNVNCTLEWAVLPRTVRARVQGDWPQSLYAALHMTVRQGVQNAL